MNRFCITKQFFHNVYYLIPVELQPKFLRLVEFEKIANGTEDHYEIYKDYNDYCIGGGLDNINFTDPRDSDGLEIKDGLYGLILDDKEYSK